MAFACEKYGLWFESYGFDEYFWDIGLESDVDIGTLPILE
jgi:hypothetical protein